MEQVLRHYSAADFDRLTDLRTMAIGGISKAGTRLARCARPRAHSQFDSVRAQPVSLLVQPDADERILSVDGGAPGDFDTDVSGQPQPGIAEAGSHASR